MSTAYEEAEKALLWFGSMDDLKAVCCAGDLTDRGAASSYAQWEYLCDSIVGQAARIQALGDHDTGKMGAYLSVDPTLTTSNGYRNFLQINNGSLTSYTEFANANVITIGGICAKGHSIITNGMLKRLNSRLCKTVRQGKVAVVVCHYPYDSYLLNMRAKLMGVLRSYPNVLYVSGHRHRYSTKQQCQLIRPACLTTPFGRTGADRRTKYPLRSIGVNACSTYRSGNYIYADLLRISDKGTITVRKRNVSLGRYDRTWRFNQVKSSVIVKSNPRGTGFSPKARFTYKVVFSDGKSHGGVKSGSTFTLRAGGSKRFASIPAGVLVRMKLVSVPKGWSKPASRSIEASSRTKVLKFKPIYRDAPKQAKANKSAQVRLRAA